MAGTGGMGKGREEKDGASQPLNTVTGGYPVSGEGRGDENCTKSAASTFPYFNV